MSIFGMVVFPLLSARVLPADQRHPGELLVGESIAGRSQAGRIVECPDQQVRLRRPFLAGIGQRCSAGRAEAPLDGRRAFMNGPRSGPGNVVGLVADPGGEGRTSRPTTVLAMAVGNEFRRASRLEADCATSAAAGPDLHHGSLRLAGPAQSV